MALFDFMGGDTQEGPGLLGNINAWLDNPRNAAKLQAFGDAMLKAGAPSPYKNGWGMALGSGFGAMNQAGSQFDQQQFQKQFQGLQMKKLQSDIAENDQQTAMKKAAMEQQQRIQQLLSGNTAMTMGAQQGDIGPTVTNAQRIPQTPVDQYNNYASILERAGLVDQGMKYRQEATKLAPEIKDYKMVIGPDGKSQFVGLRKDGGTPIPVKGMSEVDYNKPFNPDGTPNTAYQNYQIGKAKAGATNVSVSTEKTFLNSLAGGIGKDIETSKGNATGAVNTLNTLANLDKALNSGNIMAGPGTKVGIVLSQIGGMMGVTGKDANEKLVNTRQAIQSLAQLELDAAQQMKGQGQITEAERSIIRRAAAGEISDFTLPELRLLSSTLSKTARYKIDSHNATVDSLAKNPNAKELVPFLRVSPPKGGFTFLGVEDK